MKLVCIVMAAGQARRFGANKLLQDFGGRPLCSRALAAAREDCFSGTIVVTAYDAVAALAEGRWRLTPEGFLLSNQLIGGLLECQEEDTFASVLRRQAGRPAERGQNG